MKEYDVHTRLAADMMGFSVESVDTAIRDKDHDCHDLAVKYRQMAKGLTFAAGPDREIVAGRLHDEIMIEVRPI